MRSFADEQGRYWQAALLDASYGRVLLVFSALHDARIRRQILAVENLADAMLLLSQFDEADLRARLIDAEPWDPARDGA